MANPAAQPAPFSRPYPAPQVLVDALCATMAQFGYEALKPGTYEGQGENEYEGMEVVKADDGGQQIQFDWVGDEDEPTPHLAIMVTIEAKY